MHEANDAHPSQSTRREGRRATDGARHPGGANQDHHGREAYARVVGQPRPFTLRVGRGILSI